MFYQPLVLAASDQEIGGREEHHALRMRHTQELSESEVAHSRTHDRRRPREGAQENRHLAMGEEELQRIQKHFRGQ